ncbi:MAG: hypothetical protein PHN80_09270 [Hespellia sp.]|nr:hypothetical protein [Hespellia sp.]
MRNFKRTFFVVIILIFCVAVTNVANYVIIPYSYARITMHNIASEEHDILYVGSSHGLCGIDPDIVEENTGESGINLCFGGEYLRDSYYMVKEAASHHTPKKIVYELDPGYWVSPENQNGDFGRLYYEMPLSKTKCQYFFAKMLDADFRTIIFPWYNYRSQLLRIKDTVKIKGSQEYDEYDPAYFNDIVESYRKSGMIYRNRIEGEKSFDNFVLWDEKNIQEISKTYFEKLKVFCDEKGIELIVITTPIPRETQEMYEQQYADADQYFRTYFEKQKVEYYNFNYMDLGGFNRALSEFADGEGHMYGDTAEKFSGILANTLKNQ